VTGPARLGPRFLALWTASAVSTLGDGVTDVAAPLLVAGVTSNPMLVAGTAFASMLPWLLFALLSGGLVDRLDRRHVMIAVDCARAGAVGLFGAAILAGDARIPFLYGVLFLLGTGETLHRAASLSMLTAVVDHDLLERANARLAGARMVAQRMIAGPLGGFLFAVTAALPFLLDGVSFLLGVGLLLLIRGSYRARPVGPTPAARPSLLAEIRVGLRWLLGHRLLRTMAVLIGLLNVTLTAALSVLVLLARQRLGLGPVGYGVLFTTLAAGGLLGTIVGERLIRRFTASVTVRVGLLIETAFHLVLALSRSPVVTGAAFAVFGMHGALWTIVASSQLQRRTPADMQGRVNSVYLFLAAGGTALGALLGGAVAGWFGITAPYWIGFVVAAAVTAATWRVFDRETMRSPEPAVTS
jgi:MFS family permease